MEDLLQKLDIGAFSIDDFVNMSYISDEFTKPQEQFLSVVVNDWLNSDKRKDMLVAKRYYRNQNDITFKKRYFIDRKGEKVEQDLLSNTKLSHPFLRNLTDQKIDYFLAKPFSVVPLNDSDEYAKELEKCFDRNFASLLKDWGREAINCGIAWVQPYYDIKGKLQFKLHNSEEIRPFWANSQKTKLAAVLRVYSVNIYTPKGEKKELRKAEWWNSTGYWTFTADEDGYHADSVKKSTFTIADGETLYSASWDKVPFIAMRYNDEEIPLLDWVKPLIDDYDEISSELSNNIKDIPDSIKIVKNYDGTDKEEFTHNLNTFRTAFVSGDGDVTALNTPLDVEAIEKHLERLKKDIFESGNGVDTQEQNLTNVSGVALRFKYASLDMDCSGMANSVVESLQEIAYYFNTQMSLDGKVFDNTAFTIEFGKEHIMNTAEMIQECAQSVGVVSDETIIANHPFTVNAKEEFRRFKAEQEAEKEEEIDREGRNQNNIANQPTN